MSPAGPLLDYRQQRYALRALRLPAGHPVNSLIPPTLRYGDGSAQPEEHSDYNLEWSSYRTKPRNLGQRLAQKLDRDLDIDPSEGCEIAYTPKRRSFPGSIAILDKERAKQEARKQQPGLTLWTDGSKRELEGTGIGIAWKRGPRWLDKGLALGKGKEAFDAELLAITEALNIAQKEYRINSYNAITIFSDSQRAIKRVEDDRLGPGQALAIQAIAQATWLAQKGVDISVKWVPSHKGIEGNERADQLAKKAAEGPKQPSTDEYRSFTYIEKTLRAQNTQNIQKWLLEKEEKRIKQQQAIGRPKIVDKTPFLVKKRLASRFFQLKMGHAITGTYLHRIRKQNNKNCWWCSNRNQTIHHLLFDCTRWRDQRKEFLASLAKKGIARPLSTEDKAKTRLFNDKNASKAILAYLEATEIGLRPNWKELDLENRKRADNWGIGLLEDEEGVG